MVVPQSSTSDNTYDDIAYDNCRAKYPVVAVVLVLDIIPYLAAADYTKYSSELNPLDKEFFVINGFPLVSEIIPLPISKLSG